jgi:hypothetical protein
MILKLEGETDYSKIVSSIPGRRNWKSMQGNSSLQNFSTLVRHGPIYKRGIFKQLVFKYDLNSRKQKLDDVVLVDKL